MTIFSTIGMAWVIFTSALATVAILYLAYIGLVVMVRHGQITVTESTGNDPVPVKTLPVTWGRKQDQRVVGVGL